MTRRDFLAEAEKYEAILTSQREAGIDRSPDDVFGNKYRTFESILHSAVIDLEYNIF